MLNFQAYIKIFSQMVNQKILFLIKCMIIFKCKVGEVGQGRVLEEFVKPNERAGEGFF